MKALREPKNLLFLVLGVGIVGILLRAALYALGTDDRGLISNYHPLHVLCFILAAAAAIYAGAAVGKSEGSNDYGDNFPANRNVLLFAILTPIWFLVNAFTALDQAGDRLDAIRAGLAFMAVPCLAYSGYCQFRGKRPIFVLHGVVCLFFAMDMICRYRVWSGNPQLVDYVFQLFACVLLTLTAYYRTAFDVGLGSRRMFRFCSLAASLFCMLAFVGPDNIQFYIGGFLWAVSGICPALEESAEEPEEI